MSGWALHTMIATSALMALVLLIRRPVARLFGARAAYALWLAPGTRLFLPPLPLGAVDSQSVTEIAMVSGTAAIPFAAVPGYSLGQLLAFGWLSGAALFLLFQVAAHRRFVGDALRQGRWLAGPSATGTELIESAAVHGPLATGILRKRILLPVGLSDRLGERQCRLALAHEQLHHQRMDLHALALSVLVLSLHWFNPLAYVAHRAFRRDLEAACDAQLAQDLGQEDREDYARAIIRCAASPVPHAICTLTTIDDLKRRLKMLKWTHGRGARLTGTAVAAILAVGGLGITAQAQSKPEPVVEKSERVEIRKVLKDGKVVEQTASSELGAEMGRCDGEKFEAAANVPGEGGNKQQTKIVLCAKTGSSPAEVATMLEDSLKRIESDGEMRGDNKEQIAAQLRARIAELRAR